MLPREKSSTKGFVESTDSRMKRPKDSSRASPTSKIIRLMVDSSTEAESVGVSYSKVLIFKEEKRIIDILESQTWREQRREVIWDGIRQLLSSNQMLYLKLVRHVNKTPQVFTSEEKWLLRQCGILFNHELDRYTKAVLQDATDPNRETAQN